jgi:hypothetical protein
MLNDNSTIKDLADTLDDLGGTIRIRAQRTRAGTRFLTSVQYPGGTAMFSNTSLGGVLDASFAFLRLHEPSTFAPVEADPNGAHVGPVPRPDPTGTRVGHVVAPLHCAVCGFGEKEGEVYKGACTNCDTFGQPCPMEPGHEGNHALPEDSGENRVPE